MAQTAAAHKGLCKMMHFDASETAPGIVWAGLLLATLVAGGCGGAKPAGIEGEVRYAGKPIAEGGIRLFELQTGLGHGAAARIVDGHYAIPSGQGLFAGPYRIELVAQRPHGQNYPPIDRRSLEELRKAGFEPRPGAAAPPGTPILVDLEPLLPDCYNVNSTLRVVLKPGENHHDLDLPSVVGPTKPANGPP
jgi:hypothetical protein